MRMSPTNTESLYNKFINVTRQKIVDKYNYGIENREFARPLTLNDVTIRKGRKFDRIFNRNSIWGFVVKNPCTHKGEDCSTGDVLKAQGLHQPAKHVRGNIFMNNDEWFHWTGPKYMLDKKQKKAE